MNKSISVDNPETLPERIWPYFGWIVCLLFATILVLDRAVYNLLTLIAVGLAFAAIYTYRPKLDTDLRFFFLVLAANLLLALPNLILGRDGLLSLENPIRILFMVPLILAVMRHGLKARYICVGLTVGMLVSALIITWQHYLQGVALPGIHYHHLLFSEVAMSAFAILLAACLGDRDRLVPLYVAGLLAALYCVILSGSRGTLLAIGPIGLFLLWWGWRRGDLGQLMSGRRAFILPAFLLFMGAIIVANGKFIDRVELAVIETTNYFDKDIANTSVGLRLEMWRGSLIAAREHPLLGLGERDRKNYFKEKISNDKLDPAMALAMRHAHNDFFRALETRGVPGLILQLLIYASPMVIFIQGLTKKRGEQLFAALSGSLVTVAYATYSLTEVPMYNGLPLVFFIVTISLTIGMLKHPNTSAAYDDQV